MKVTPYNNEIHTNENKKNTFSLTGHLTLNRTTSINIMFWRFYQVSPLVVVFDEPKCVSAIVALRRKRQQDGQRVIGFQTEKKNDQLVKPFNKKTKTI